MSDTASWICPTCKVAVTTPFCARCGEEPVPPRDLTLRGLAEKVIHALTSIDARAARSAWALLRHPGQLTLARTAGVRKPYVAPFQLFLIANVLFFALQWLTGENVFSSSLASHLHQQDWSSLAQSLLASRLAATHASLEQHAPVFDRAVVLSGSGSRLRSDWVSAVSQGGCACPRSRGNRPGVSIPALCRHALWNLIAEETMTINPSLKRTSNGRSTQTVSAHGTTA